jgi:hypothetical protein
VEATLGALPFADNRYFTLGFEGGPEYDYVHVQVASQCEPMYRLSRLGPVDGGSPSIWLGFQKAVSSNSQEEETAFHGYGSQLILLLTDLLAIALASKRLFHAFLFTRF